MTRYSGKVSLDMKVIYYHEWSRELELQVMEVKSGQGSSAVAPPHDIRKYIQSRAPLDIPQKSNPTWIQVKAAETKILEIPSFFKVVFSWYEQESEW